MPELPASVPTAVLRILDANQNRSREALRVIEEYLRFALDDAHLAELAKRLRHRLQEALAPLSRSEMLSARDTAGDVGTQITTASESQRSDAQDVVAAAFSRLQESLRSLEEYGKTVDGSMAAAIEGLRYDSYTLEKAIGTTSRACERLAECRLYVLIDASAHEAAFAARVERLVTAGVDCLQLRDKHLNDRTLLARAKLLRKLTAGSGTLFIMNDRPDLALLSHADGVHVGQEELPVAEVRRIVGVDMLIGLSTHSIEQAREAVLAGADYIGVGPVFPSGTKAFEQFPGLDFVREVAQEIRLPAFAIGGIDSQNVGQVVAAGLRRVAVGGAANGAADVATMVTQMKVMLSREQADN